MFQFIQPKRLATNLYKFNIQILHIFTEVDLITTSNIMVIDFFRGERFAFIMIILCMGVQRNIFRSITAFMLITKVRSANRGCLLFNMLFFCFGQSVNLLSNCFYLQKVSKQYQNILIYYLFQPVIVSYWSANASLSSFNLSRL